MMKTRKSIIASVSFLITYSFVSVDPVIASGDFEEEFIPIYMKLRAERAERRQQVLGEDSGREGLFSWRTEDNVLKFQERVTGFVKGKIEALFTRVEQGKQQFMKDRVFPWQTMSGFTSFPISKYFMGVVFAEGKQDSQVTSKGQSSTVGSRVDLQSSSTATAEVDDIQAGIIKANQRLTRLQVEEPVTILLGKTGTGKSVIYNHLQGVPLVAIKLEDGNFAIDRRDKPRKEVEEDGMISHKTISETAYPYMSKGIVDCPGFEATQGSAQEIINAYSLDTVFKRTQDLRIVLVVSKKMLDDKAEDFLRSIKGLGEVFPGQATYIKKGLNLVVTKFKSSEIDEKMFRSKVSKILDENERLKVQVLTDFQREILQFFKSEGQISFFPSPEAEGPIKMEKQLVRSDAIKTKGLSPKIFVSDSAKLHIIELAEMITNDTSKFLFSFQKRFKGHTKQLVKSHKGPASALRSSFKSISDDFTIASPSSQESREQVFSKNVKNVTRALERFDPVLSSEFTTLVRLREFLIQQKPDQLDINLDLNPNGVLTAVSKDLQLLSEDFTVHSTEKTPILIGHIIGTSDLTRSDLPKLVNISMLNIYAENSLLIDSDVRMTRGSMSFVSPFWNVIGKCRIDLRGKDAESFILPASDGENGRPGSPGYSGGNFYGVVDELYNSRDLTLDVSGGNGGNGQDGGKGINGEDGEDGDEDNVKERKIAVLTGKHAIKHSDFVESIRWPFFANDEYRLTYRSGKPGKKGGNSGAGGIGGFGGKKGIVYFEDSMFTDVTHRYEIDITAVDGERGLEGAHGQPGKGGRHGKVFEGVYIEKPIRGWGMLKRTVANGGVGGAVGALIGAGVGAFGGPVGIAAGAQFGALIGGGGGGAAPALSTIGDQLINSGWEVGPCMHTCEESLTVLLSTGTLKVEEHAADGEKPKAKNSGAQDPIESPPINYEEIRRNWRQIYKSLPKKPN